jgi:hypothetical protein
MTCFALCLIKVDWQNATGMQWKRHAFGIVISRNADGSTGILYWRSTGRWARLTSADSLDLTADRLPTGSAAVI